MTKNYLKWIATAAFSAALLFISYNSFTYSSGPNAGLTNAPGESNCTSCHSGSLNSGSYLSALKLNGDWDGGGYLPDSTYTITIEHSQPNISRYGFQVTVLDASNKQVGDLVNTNSRTQKRTTSISGSTRQYITQTSGGTSKTGTNKVDWTFEWDAPSSNVGAVTFYVSLNAANGNNGTSGDTIYAQKFTIQPSSLLPRAQITTNDTNICALSVASFKGGGTGSPSSYEWIFAGGSPSTSTAQNPQVNYNSPGKYFARLRVKNALGTSDWDTAVINVQQAPSAFIGGGDRKICPGDSVQLSVGAGSGFTYLWNNSKITNSIWVKDTGTYYVIVTNRSGCSRVSNEIRVDKFPEPKATLQSNIGRDSLCAGQQVVLTASSGFDTVYWYRDMNLFRTGTAVQFSENPRSTTVYQVRVKDSNKCLSNLSDSVVVKVVQRLPAPSIKCSNATRDEVTWEWDPVGHEGYEVSYDSIFWNAPSNGKNGVTHTRKGLNPDTNYKLYVRALDVSPCFYSPISSLVCRTGPCDSLFVQLNYKNEVCKGESVDVRVSGLNGKRYGLYFEGGAVFTDTAFQFTPLLSRSYLLEVEDSMAVSCRPARYLIDVKVDNIQDLRFQTQRPNNVFCTYDSIRFEASSGNELYRFYVNNDLRKTTQDSFYYEALFSNGDSAWVEVEKGACKLVSDKIQLSVVPDPQSGFTFSREGSIYSFVPNIDFYRSYFWQFGDGFTSVLMEPTHDYVSSAGKTVEVNLKVTDNNDCVSDTTQELAIPDFASIGELNGGVLRIYPSPVKQILHLEFEGLRGTLTYELLDLNGANIGSGTLSEGVYSIPVEHLNSGAYLIRVAGSNGHQIVSRFVVE